MQGFSGVNLEQKFAFALVLDELKEGVPMYLKSGWVEAGGWKNARDGRAGVGELLRYPSLPAPSKKESRIPQMTENRNNLFIFPSPFLWMDCWTGLVWTRPNPSPILGEIPSLSREPDGRSSNFFERDGLAGQEA